MASQLQSNTDFRRYTDPDPVTAYRADAAPHWHLIGQELRPVHEQLDTLSDAAVWSSLAMPASTTAPADNGMAVRLPGFAVASVMRGNEYSCVVITGDLDGRAVAQVRSYLRAVLDSGARWVLVDLSGAGQGAERLAPTLMQSQLRLWARHGVLVLLNVPAQIQAAYTLGRLSQALFTCDPAHWPAVPGSAVSS